MDLSVFSGILWEKEFEIEMKRQASLFPLFRVEPIPAGTKRKSIPVTGAGTAKALTPGTAPAKAGQTTGSVSVDIDEMWAYDEDITDIEEMQTSVSSRSAFAEAATGTLLGKIDEQLLSLLSTYAEDEEVPEGQIITSAAPVEATGTAIATELQVLVTRAVTALQTNSAVGIAGCRSRFALLDSLIHNCLVMGSDKQSPERTDLPFGIMTGEALPVLGTRIYNAGLLPRTFVDETEYEAAHTVVSGYICLPSAVVLGVQEMPTIRIAENVPARSVSLCTTEYFGLSAGLPNQFVEIRIKIAGNIA